MADAFSIDKGLVRRSFSRAAADYDRSAVLQHEVCRRLAERLACIRLEPRRILDAGAGTGYGGRLLSERFPGAGLVELDIAEGMLHAARGARPGWRRWLPGGRRDAYVCADLENLPLAAESIDLAWSNLAMQWCNDLDRLFAGMHRVVRNDGVLIFTTFGPDTLKELRQAFGALDGFTHVSRFADMHDIGDALVRNGFASPVMEMELFTLTYDRLRDLMLDLKAIGAHNATSGRRRGMTGKEEWRRLEEAYERFRREGKLPATYEVIYGHAWRGQVPARNLPEGERVVRFRGRP